MSTLVPQIEQIPGVVFAPHLQWPILPKILSENISLSLRFAQILKSIGYDILLDNKPLVKSDTSNIEMNPKDEKLFNSIEVKDK